MKKLFSILLSASLLFGAVSCEKDPKQDPDLEPVINKTYILNSGSYAANNASLTLFNAADTTVKGNVFFNTNGKALGDTGQDILAYGSKMYISVYGSGVIFVTDCNGKIVNEITLTDFTSPRNLTAANGKVYASYYDGAVAQIDTASFSVKTSACGVNPEKLKVSNNKLYVAISEGMNYPNYGKTVGIYNASTMDEIKTVEVGVNPGAVEVDELGNVFVICTGDYGATAPSLKVINSKTDAVSDVKLEVTVDAKALKLTPSWISMGADNKLYLVCAKEGDAWNAPKTIYTYNTKTSKLEKFVTDGTVVNDIYSITADKVSGYVYVGTSDYKTNGDMFLFTTEGKLHTSFDSEGINPIAVASIQEK